MVWKQEKTFTWSFNHLTPCTCTQGQVWGTPPQGRENDGKWHKRQSNMGKFPQKRSNQIRCSYGQQLHLKHQLTQPSQPGAIPAGSAPGVLLTGIMFPASVWAWSQSVVVRLTKAQVETQQSELYSETAGWSLARGKKMAEKNGTWQFQVNILELFWRRGASNLRSIH